MKNIFEIKSLWDSLVAWYRFDEKSGGKIFDHSVNLNHGIVHGAVPSFPGWKFNGSSDYINCGNDASLDITDAITIEMWVKPNTVSGSNGYLISKNNLDSSDNQYAIHTVNGRAKYYGSGLPFTPFGVIPYNVWTYVVFTRTSGGIGQFYINGTVSGDPSACDMPSKTFPVRLGCRWDQGTTPFLCFNGAIGEIRIYNREISANEVLALFNGTKKFYF